MATAAPGGGRWGTGCQGDGGASLLLKAVTVFPPSIPGLALVGRHGVQPQTYKLSLGLYPLVSLVSDRWEGLGSA